MGLLSGGTCEYTCTFEKNIFFPNDDIKLTIKIDNSKCSKKIEKYKVKFIKQIIVNNDENVNKPLYVND